MHEEVDGVPSGGNAWASPFAHDAAGNLTTAPLPAALNSSWTCSYDPWNRLVQVKIGTSVKGTYSYDGLFRRVKKNQNATGKSWDYYYSDQWQLLEAVGSDTRRFLWGLRYPDDLIFREDATSSSPSSSSTTERRYTIHVYYHITELKLRGSAW